MDKKEATTKDLRRFGIIFGMLFGVFCVVYIVKGRVMAGGWLIAVAVVSVAIACIRPGMLRSVYSLFIGVTGLMLRFFIMLALIIMYYLVITPIGVVMRLAGKDPLDNKIDHRGASYWVKRDNDRLSAGYLEKQF